jgi:hypothetical protein
MKEQLFATALAIITTCLLFMLRHFILIVGERDENQRRARARRLKKANNPKLKAGEGLNDSPKTFLVLTSNQPMRLMHSREVLRHPGFDSDDSSEP